MEIQGWLQVCDIQGIPAHQLSCGQSAPTVWLEKYCSLSGRRLWIIEAILLDQFLSEDENKQDTSINASIENGKTTTPEDTVEAKGDDRRCAAGELMSSHNGKEIPMNKSFIQKKITPSIRRTRNMKTNIHGKENRPYVDSSMVSQSVAGGRPPESEFGSTFFTPTTESPDMLDLSTEEEAIIRPLHQSILGKEHCFEVITVNGSRCFCCKSAGEREAWIEKLKRTLNPNLDNAVRMEHQLNLWIQEAKGVPVRKKYFCEICLDRQLFARTTSKVKDDNTTFWGEHFEFTSIPDIENITIHLYKDSDKKKKKDKDYIGLVNISIKSLFNRQALEKWYTLSTPSGKNKNNSGEIMAIRIKARFQSVCVLPMDQYKELGEVISRDYMSMCRTLHGALSVAKKDELSRSLVCIMHATGIVKEFLTEIVMHEIANVEEESLIFRENTIATKAVEHYLRLVGMGYLHEALGDFIAALYESDEDCEVDGSRLPINASLEHNQKNLQMCCEIAMCKIIGSIKIFPNELREVFSKWREQCDASNRPRIASRLITASLFLRLICPAILNPSLFSLANEIPRTNAARTLTLVAKVIQNLANRSRFGDKEEYMKFMNGFVREQWDQMGRFLDDVTDGAKTSAQNGFEGFIDLGRELAKLHAFLTENLPDLDQSVVKDLGALPQILANISKRVNSLPASLTLRRGGNSEPSHISNPPELSSLDEIAEDIQISNANESIVVSPESNIVLPKAYVSNPKPSLEIDRLPTVRGTASHGSQNSLSGGESYNNSNNSQRPLAPVENIIKPPERSSIGQVLRSQHHSKPPLSFSNPAYRQLGPPDLKRGIRSPATLMPGGKGSEQNLVETPVSSKEDSSFTSRHHIHAVEASLPSVSHSVAHKGPALPISFSNPLQALQRIPHSVSQPSMGSHSQNKTEVNYAWSATAASSNNGTRLVEAPLSNINGTEHCSSETESANGSCRSDDTLSSRPSSTSTGSTANGNKNLALPLLRTEKVKAAKVKNRTGTREPPSGVQGKFSKGRPEDVDGRLTAIATSTNIPISNARHRTGLQKQQQQQSSRNSKLPHTTGIGEQGGAKVSSTFTDPHRPTPHVSHSSPTSAVKSGFGKSHRSKYSDANTNGSRIDPESAPTNTRDDGHVVSGKTVPVVAYNTASAARVRTTRKTRPGSVSSSNSQVIHQTKSHMTSERHTSRRNDYQRVAGHSAHQVAEPPALPPQIPEGPLSPEERTAQWVLSSIAPVPKDLSAKPVTAPPPNSGYNQLKSSKSANKNYDDLVSRLKMDVDALRARLSEAEESTRASKDREETLMEQLKEGDRREARLLERLRILEEKIARYIQEKDDKKAEFLHRMSKADGEQRRERGELQLVIDEKDAILSAQRKRIASLEENNARFTRAINDLGGSIKGKKENGERMTGNCVSEQEKLHFRNPVANCRNPAGPHTPQNRRNDGVGLEPDHSSQALASSNVEYRIECLSSATSSSSSV